ncbi:MAG: hypothetical protein E6J90_03330 [Deltaproteobacteria bacterium]|nr:MAG: hypothetical protein E6J91_16595 [Deltaproteobacteria bacterium]TMQ27057.1 MAG: hypothetical protein E6J90_03330 [Deltaproteobacteria bacterium]
MSTTLLSCHRRSRHVMSITTTRSFQCRCGEPLEVTVADSLNAGRHPHLRDALIAMELHRFTCEACGATTLVDTPFTYFDHERKQLFLVLRRGDLASEAEGIARLAELYKVTFGEAASPGVQALGAGMMVRLCLGVLAVRDKVIADEARLNDLVLEELKCQVLASYPELALHAVVALWLDRVTADELVLLAESAHAAEHRVVHVPRAAYDALLERGAQALLASRPELVRGPHVSMLRLGLR